MTVMIFGRKESFFKILNLNATYIFSEHFFPDLFFFINDTIPEKLLGVSGYDHDVHLHHSGESDL